MKKFDAEPEIRSWHYGYRAACKDICERFGLDNTDEIELLVKERDALKAYIFEIEPNIRKALNKSYQLGQIYWQQADSESIKQQNKSWETRNTFDLLVATTIADMRGVCNG